MSRAQQQKLWNRRILVVDDEKAIANSYVEILEPAPKSNVMPLSSRSSRSADKADASVTRDGSFDFEVDVAYNAEEALEKIEKSIVENNPYAMGFFDVKLGAGMDGVELVSEIFKLCPDMFAVFVTAYNDRSIENIQSVVGEGHVDHWDYLSKPFSHSEIFQKARNFTSLWNLTREQNEHEKQLQIMRSKMMDNEISSSIAAVARGVGHEFGNILMQIIGKAELSLNKDEKGLRQAMDKVLDASQRAIEILDRFKDLTETGSTAVEKEDFSLRDLVNGVQELMEHQIKVSQIELTLDVPKKLWVHANQTSLMQVLVNLIINAIHASGNDGRVSIHAEKSKGVCYLTVRDHGPGVPDDLLEKVTQPLFTTKGEGGTGLGLAICKEIIEIEHKGRLSVGNAEDGSTGFVVKMEIPDKELQEVA